MSADNIANIIKQREQACEKLRQTAPRPHVPQKLPLDTFSLITPQILKLLSQADHAIGQYAGFLFNTPNPSLLMAPVTTQEAVLSSKLEGTHATLEDILTHEAGAETEIADDEIKEIINYRVALHFALDNISPIADLASEGSRSPLTVKILKRMHAILLDNVRGATKHPGCFKTGQNYIGGYANISFTPLPPELTEEYMSNLERYIHQEEANILIQSAIIHAQFEMIHPFEDGNGRIGRLLIPLFLYYSGLIPLPTFYMSSFFEKNREAYISNLSNISTSNDWASWIEFFLQGIIIQSKENTAKSLNILRFYEDCKAKSDEIKSYYYIAILDFIFAHPIFTVKQLIDSDTINASRQTVYSTLQKIADLGIITTNTNTPKAKNNIYLCNQLLSIIDS